MRTTSASRAQVRREKTAALVLLAGALYAAASVGMCDVAGFSDVFHRMQRVDWPWLIAAMLAVAAGLIAYTRAWSGIVDGGGARRLSRRERLLSPIVGFGSFFVRGGSTVDRHVLQAHGLSRREIAVRMTALDGLEHAPLAVGCFCIALFALARGRLDPPPLDFVWPWVVVPPLGTVAAVWLTRRYREQLRDRCGWRGRCGVALDSLYLLWQLASSERRRAVPYLAMAGFWTAELFALWASVAAFGISMPVPSLVFAYVAAYVVTRRPAPLGGAGPLDLLLPLALWACGAPLSAAVVGTIAYRFFSLWLPLPVAIHGSTYLAARGNGAAKEPEPALT